MAEEQRQKRAKDFRGMASLSARRGQALECANKTLDEMRDKLKEANLRMAQAERAAKASATKLLMRDRGSKQRGREHHATDESQSGSGEGYREFSAYSQGKILPGG